MAYLVLALLCAFFFVIVYGYLNYQRNQKKFGTSIPVVKQIVDPRLSRRGFLWREKFDVFQSLKTPVYALTSASDADLVIGDPEVVKQITVTHRQDFPKPPLRAINIMGPNMVSAEGEIWKRHRKVAAPNFSDRNYRLVAEASVRIANLMFQFWDTKIQEAKEIPVQIHKDMLQVALSVLSHAAFGKPLEWEDSTKQSNFNTNINNKNDKNKNKKYRYTFQQSLEILFHSLIAALLTPKFLRKIIPFGKIKEWQIAFNDFHSQMKDMVIERTQLLIDEGIIEEGSKDISSQISPKNSDLFTNLLVALLQSQRNLSKNNYLMENEFYGNLFAFIFAGHETTALTLNFACILLAINPDIQKKAFEEISKVLGTKDDQRPPTYDDFIQFHYIHYIMKETLRLFPPVPSIAKLAARDITLQIPLSKYKNTLNNNNNLQNTQGLPEDEMTPLHIPRGTGISIDICGIHRNPIYWPQPNEFIPERFDSIHTPFKNEQQKKEEENKIQYKDKKEMENVEDDEEKVTKSELPYNRYAFLPFSEGIRSCIGKKFSEVEFTYTLTCMLQKYTWTLSNKHTKEEALEAVENFTLRPKSSIELIFKKREL